MSNKSDSDQNWRLASTELVVKAEDAALESFVEFGKRDSRAAGLLLRRFKDAFSDLDGNSTLLYGPTNGCTMHLIPSWRTIQRDECAALVCLLRDYDLAAVLFHPPESVPTLNTIKADAERFLCNVLK